MAGNALSSTENLFQSSLLLLENTRKQRIQTILPSDTAFLTPGNSFRRANCQGKLLDNGTNTPIRRIEINGKTLIFLSENVRKMHE